MSKVQVGGDHSTEPKDPMARRHGNACSHQVFLYQELTAHSLSKQEPTVQPLSMQDPTAHPLSMQEITAQPPSMQEPTVQPPSLQDPTAYTLRV